MVRVTLTSGIQYAIICTTTKKKQGYNTFTMMNRLRGRSLAHPGCLTGVTVGLTLGIILAGVLAAKFGVAYNTVLLVWLALTVGLGAIGWIAGTILTPRFPALPKTDEAHNVDAAEKNASVVATEQSMDNTTTSESIVHE